MWRDKFGLKQNCGHAGYGCAEYVCVGYDALNAASLFQRPEVCSHTMLTHLIEC